MELQLIPQRTVLRDWETMSRALDFAKNDDVLLVNKYFNRTLLKQAADRRCLRVTVIVDPNAY